MRIPWQKKLFEIGISKAPPPLMNYFRAALEQAGVKPENAEVIGNTWTVKEELYRQMRG